MSQGLSQFPHLTYSIATDENTRNRKLYRAHTKTPITIAPETTQTITVHTEVSSNIDTTGVFNPVINHCSGNTLVVASSISTAVNRKLDIRVTNTAQTPYTIKKNEQYKLGGIQKHVIRRSERFKTAKYSGT